MEYLWGHHNSQTVHEVIRIFDGFNVHSLYVKCTRRFFNANLVEIRIE